MFCPNCASQIDNVKFCRSCGANVSLVPQALSGKISDPADDEKWQPGRPRRRRQQKEVTIEGAMRSFFTGIAFLAVSLAVWRFFPGGFTWWFWMLIPAFACMGEGIGKCMRLRNERERALAAPEPIQAAAPQIQAPIPTTSNLEVPVEPSSVVEHTTYHLK